MPEQAALDLGLALGQDPAALGQPGHPDLELLAARPYGPAVLGQGRARPPRPPRSRAGTAPSRSRSACTAASRSPASATGLAGRRELLAQPAQLLHRRAGRRRPPCRGPRRAGRGPARPRPGHRGPRPGPSGRRARSARAASAAAAASVARRWASSTAAAVTTLVDERTRHPVAAKRSPSGVTTIRSSRSRERSIASSQPSTRTAWPISASSTDSAIASP